jgi:PAS domain S-box-containing protein
MSVNNNSVDVREERFSMVLNSLDAVVYVADMETYEILFLNRHAKDLFGDVTGKTCWQTLQAGQTKPCDFCTNKFLLDESGEPTGVYRWEFQNTVTGRWFDVRDRAIRWPDGRLVRLEIATDITERKKLEVDLRRALAEVKTLSGLLPICAWCHKIRDDQGYWNSVEEYMEHKTDAKFTHGICPECLARVEKEEAEEEQKEEDS